MESIKVTSLDISDVTEADLASNQNATYIKEPGLYNLEITDYQMGMKKKPDGANKNWGWLRVVARDTETGSLVSGFLDVPVDALAYTSKDGKKSHVKSAQFKQFLISLGIKDVTISSLSKHINNLGNILDAKPTFKAILGYSNDHVAYRGKDSEGNNRYGIELKAGGGLLDEDGVEVIRANFNEMKDYYTQFKGFSPETGLSFRAFK